MIIGQIDRHTYLGGSDVAAILGISPWRTPLDVYLDKVEGSQPITDPAKLKILERGKRLEPYVLDMLCIEQGIELIGRNNRYQHPDHPFIAAEIDAETSDGRNVEGKTTADFYSRKLWGDAQTDEIPVYYTAQCMHGMMVKPAPSTLLPVMLGIDDFRVYEVHRDDETIAAIREKELEFWDRVQRRDPPPASTVSDVIRLFERDAGTSIEADDAIMACVHNLKEIKARIKVDEDDAEELECRIKLYLGEHSELRYGAKKLLTWKSQDTKRFDSAAFKAAHPSIYEKFTKTTTSRVLRIK